MEKLKQMKEALVGCVQTQIYGNMDKVDAKELGEAVDMIKDLAEAIYYCTITEAMEKEEKEGKEGKEGGKGGQHGMMYYNQRVMPMPMPMYHYPMEYYDPRYRERYMPASMYAQGGSGGGGSSSGGSGGSSGGSSGGGGSRNAQGDGGYDSSSRGNNARGGGSRGYQDGMMYMEEPWYEDMMYARGGRGGQGGGGGNRNYPPMEMLIKDPREGRSGERRRMYMEGKGMKDKTSQMKELESYMQELSSDLTEMVQDASPEEKQLLQQKISTLAQKIK